MALLEFCDTVLAVSLSWNHIVKAIISIGGDFELSSYLKFLQNGFGNDALDEEGIELNANGKIQGYFVPDICAQFEDTHINKNHFVYISECFDGIRIQLTPSRLINAWKNNYDWIGFFPASALQRSSLVRMAKTEEFMWVIRSLWDVFAVNIYIQNFCLIDFNSAAETSRLQTREGCIFIVSTEKFNTCGGAAGLASERALLWFCFPPYSLQSVEPAMQTARLWDKQKYYGRSSADSF